MRSLRQVDGTKFVIYSFKVLQGSETLGSGKVKVELVQIQTTRNKNIFWLKLKTGPDLFQTDSLLVFLEEINRKSS